MDPLFERRELTRSIHIEAKQLQRNIHAILLAQLRHKYEGICITEGFVNRHSITVVDHSLGRANLIRGGMDYVVRFQADICMPHPGQVFRGVVNLKSKIGLHINLHPIKALLPRDLHIGNGDFEDMEEKQEIEFEVVGARFQQGDDTIVILGKLRNIVRPAAAEALKSDIEEPFLAAPIPGENSTTDGKKVVTVDVSATKSPEIKRKRLKNNTGESKNESKQ